MTHSLSQRLLARYFAALLALSGGLAIVLSAQAERTDARQLAITGVCLAGAALIWLAPWDRWPRWALLTLPPLGFAIKMWANLLGGLSPYSYSIHFILVYVWIGMALPRYAPTAFAPMLATAYCVPLWVAGGTDEVASLAHVLPTCLLVGESLGWISEQLRRVEQVDGQRMQRMEWLVHAGAELAHQEERGPLAACIAQLGLALPGAVGAAVLLPGPNRCFEVAAADGWPGTLPERFRGDEPALLAALRTGQRVGREDPRAADLAARLGADRMGIAPLVGSSRPMGLVLLARRGNTAPFDEFTDNLVRTLTMQAGLAIERIRANEALREDTLHDELTGIGNRRKANLALERLVPGDALVLIDLDHFKRVNDTHGHATGDQVLRQLGAFLMRRLREGDEAFRIGGEEFLVLLHAAGEDARTAAEHFCSAWRFDEPATTLSAGVAVHEAGRTPEQTLELADAALYGAKHAGRDRVISAR